MVLKLGNSFWVHYLSKSVHYVVITMLYDNHVLSCLWVVFPKVLSHNISYNHENDPNLEPIVCYVSPKWRLFSTNHWTISLVLAMALSFYPIIHVDNNSGLVPQWLLTSSNLKWKSCCLMYSFASVSEKPSTYKMTELLIP